MVSRDAGRWSRWLVSALCIVALLAILTLAWWAYHPGLSGAFLFDDLGSLPKLGATGAVDNWATFWRYITSGGADPTGRPLALLTFLIDGNNWPTDPYPFKLTNVILHLINGALLAWVLWWLGRAICTATSPRAPRDPLSVGGPEGPTRSPLPPPLNPPSEVGGPEGPTGSRPPPLLHPASEVGGPEGPTGSRLPPLLHPASEVGGPEGPTGSRLPLLQPLLHSASEVGGPEGPTGSRLPPLLQPLLHPASKVGGPEGPTGSRLPPLLHPPSERRGTEGDGLSSADATSPRASRDPLPMEGGAEMSWPAIAALFGAGAWLLHPLLVSTTLYIVQREAMLPATFVLIAILGWIASRESLARGHLRRGLAGMLLSAWLCTVLAVLSKANGALLPLLLLLVEWIVLAPRLPMPDASTRRWYRRAVTVFLILPSALLLAYLLYLLPGVIGTAADVRGWTIGQRLLTEPRVLTDYLRLLFVPHAHSSGLFNDAFPVSTDWLHPASAIPCIVLILALIGAGFALRKRHPAIALALLFYFGAQLMESGWIPLELYFEHRNYLPAMLLFWPIGIGLAHCGTLRWLRILVAAGVLVALAVLTFQRATLWGNAPRQAQVWAAINPDSARAQTSAALYDLQNDRPRLATARLHLAMPRHPDDLQIPLNLITAECRLGEVQPGTLAAARTALANDRVGGAVAFNWFGQALDSVGKHACQGLDYASLQGLLDAAWRNPHWRIHAGLRGNLYHLQGTLALAKRKPREALREFNLALAQKPEPGTALGQAAALGAAGYPALGLAHLDYFDTLPVPRKTGFSMSRLHEWVLRQQGWWTKELAYMRSTLEADAAARVQ